MHRDQRAAVTSALREIYDGEWSRPVGTGGGRILHWKGKCGFIGAVTPSIDKHAAITAALGERFLHYRHEKTLRALANFGNEATMREELAETIGALLAGIGGTPEPLTVADQHRIANLAEFAAQARTGVERDGYKGIVQVMPQAEVATRLAKQLAALRAGAHTVGADNDTAWRTIYKVALDSIPALRRRILTKLHEADHPLQLADLVTRTGIPKRTLDQSVEDLALIGIVDRTKTKEHNTAPWQVQLSAQGKTLWPVGNSGLGEKSQVGPRTRRCLRVGPTVMTRVTMVLKPRSSLLVFGLQTSRDTTAAGARSGSTPTTDSTRVNSVPDPWPGIAYSPISRGQD